VFKSLSSNLTTNSVLPIPQVYVRDLQTGSTTWLPGSTNSAYFLSANGLFLALRQESLGANWIMMRDLPTATERQISLSPVPGPSPRSADLACAVSDDGRFVAFVSRSDAIVPDDANGTNDVFVCDLETFTITLVSLNREGTGSANGRSDSPAISENGRFVAYRSYATDIVPGDDNSQPDIFLFDRQTGMNRLVSANRAGLGSGNGLSGTPVISANGSALFFRSLASDLAAGDYNETQDVFHYTVAAAAPADSDGDGMADAWEQSLFGDLSKNGLADTDGDGLSDLVEYKVWSNPTDPNSSFRGEIAGPSVSSEITVSWNAAPGRMYRVQYKNDLSETTWKDFGGTIAVGGSRASIVENMAGLVNQRFYRVTLVE
jgi:hypothetical protein